MHEERYPDIGAEFSRNVDELLAGARAGDCNRLSDEYRANLEFAERLANTRFGPPPRYQAGLKRTLLARLRQERAACRPQATGVLRGLSGLSRPPSPLALGLALALALLVAAYAAAPGPVTAFARRVLVFVPGIGIRDVAEGDLVSTGPVSVRLGSVPFTVEALLGDAQQTVVTYRVAGFPGGRQFWTAGTAPFLRDESGRRYPARYVHTGLMHGVSGLAVFPPLEGELQSIELVVPREGSPEWAVHIPLTHPASRALPAVELQGATATAHGVTLRVAASSVRSDGTAVLLEGETEGPGGLVSLHGLAGEPVGPLELRDQSGYLYRALPPQQRPFAFTDGPPPPDPDLGEPFHQSLYFAPLREDARELTLEVGAVVVQGEDDAATLTIPLAGLRPLATLALDRTVELGGYELRVESATLLQEGEQLALYVDVEPGPAVDGRYLGYFSVRGIDAPPPTDPESGLPRKHGFPLTAFEVAVEPGASEVTVKLSAPQLIVDGPWRLTFPVDEGQ